MFHLSVARYVGLRSPRAYPTLHTLRIVTLLRGWIAYVRLDFVRCRTTAHSTFALPLPARGFDFVRSSSLVLPLRCCVCVPFTLPLYAPFLVAAFAICLPRIPLSLDLPHFAARFADRCVRFTVVVATTPHAHTLSLDLCHGWILRVPLVYARTHFCGYAFAESLRCALLPRCRSPFGCTAHTRVLVAARTRTRTVARCYFTRCWLVAFARYALLRCTLRTRIYALPPLHALRALRTFAHTHLHALRFLSHVRIAAPLHAHYRGLQLYARISSVFSVGCAHARSGYATVAFATVVHARTRLPVAARFAPRVDLLPFATFCARCVLPGCGLVAARIALHWLRLRFAVVATVRLPRTTTRCVVAHTRCTRILRTRCWICGCTYGCRRGLPLPVMLITPRLGYARTPHTHCCVVPRARAFSLTSSSLGCRFTALPRAAHVPLVSLPRGLPRVVYFTYAHYTRMRLHTPTYAFFFWFVAHTRCVTRLPRAVTPRFAHVHGLPLGYTRLHTHTRFTYVWLRFCRCLVLCAVAHTLLRWILSQYSGCTPHVLPLAPPLVCVYVCDLRYVSLVVRARCIYVTLRYAFIVCALRSLVWTHVLRICYARRSSRLHCVALRTFRSLLVCTRFALHVAARCAFAHLHTFDLGDLSRLPFTLLGTFWSLSLSYLWVESLGPLISLRFSLSLPPPLSCCLCISLSSALGLWVSPLTRCTFAFARLYSRFLSSLNFRCVYVLYVCTFARLFAARSRL